MNIWWWIRPRGSFRWGHGVCWCSLLLALLPGGGLAQPWSGLLEPTRATDWSQVGVAGGIPARPVICQTLSPGVTAAQINTALAGCPTGETVFLSAGTYALSAGITFGSAKSGVTLRGAGPHQTFLVFSGASSCGGLTATVCLRSTFASHQTPQNTTTWTAGYTQGTSVLTVGSATGISVGTLLILDQLDDATDTGGIYVCATTVCTDEGGGGAGRPTRGQQQLVQVTQVAGTSVTVTPPLRMPNWRSGQSPGIFWNASAALVSGLGVEDLSLDVTNATDASGIVMMALRDSWVQRVRILNPGRNHVWLWQVLRSTLRDNYFYGGQTAHSTSYGIEEWTTTSNLVENNIFQHVTAPLAHNGPDVGSVFGYNFAIDDNYTEDGNAPEWMIPSVLFHEVGMSHLLHEGNDGLGYEHDGIHGTTHFNTALRNHWYGDMWNTPVKTANTPVINLAAFARFFNLVGNVLGRTGYYTTYEVTLGFNDLAIYDLGWSAEVGITPTDANVKTTMLRWGNYDTVSNAVRWCGTSSNTGWSTTCASASEVPTGLPLYANPVPATEQIPASFYLSSKPSWFGAVPWPPIGPEVTGGSVPGFGGHAHKIPARLCWESLAAEGAQPYKVFTPQLCYASVSGPTVTRPVP